MICLGQVLPDEKTHAMVETSTHDPIISVVIPTYNRAYLISRAVASVLQQSYSSFEIIVVDDGSTDRTAEVLAGFSDPRIRYLRLPKNTGGAAARNLGIREAGGRYIAFLDSDDEWLPSKLEKQVPVLERSNENLGVIYCNYAFIYPEGIQDIRPGLRGHIFQELLKGSCPAITSAVLIDRLCFEKLGGFDERLPSYQDYDLWLRIAKHYQFDFVDSSLVRIHMPDFNRVSVDLNRRIPGFIIFLEKWGSQFRRALGDSDYSRFIRESFGLFYSNAAAQSFHRHETWTGIKRLIEAIGYTPLNMQLYGKLGLAILGGHRLYNLVGGWRRRIITKPSR